MNSTRADSTLTSLAMLKVNYDSHHGDYLDYLIPFTKYVISSGTVAITPEKVSDAIASEFGLEIPIFVTEKLLKRLVKYRTLKREHHQFILQSQITTDGFEERRNSAKRDYRKVCNSVCAHVKKEFDVDLSTDDAATGVVKCIEKFSIEYLRSYQKGTAIKPDNSDSSSKLEFYASHFIRKISIENTDLFQSLVNLVKGKMLSNALLCDDLSSTTSKFQKVIFYIDSPLLLRLLNLDSLEQNRTAIELLGTLKNLKGRVKIFRHSVLEAENILHHTAENFDDPRQSSGILPELRKRGWSGSDLLMLISKLEDKIDVLGIQIENAPHYDPKYQIDENNLEQELIDRLKYRNPKAAQVDVNSVRSIYALRKGVEPTCIEKAIAVFVTHNANFSRTSYEFGRNLPSTTRVPAVITDYSLLNLAWLKAPVKSGELPAIQLISNCAAALEPTVPLWERYLTEVDKLKDSGGITSDDHQLLRYSPTVREELMNLTVGSELQLSTDTVSTILRRTKAKLTEEKDKEIGTLKDKIDAEEEARTRRKEILFSRATKQSKYLTKAFFVAITCVILASTIIPAFTAAEESKTRGVLLAVGIILSILNLVFGWSAISVVEKIRFKILNVRFRNLCDLAGISYDESDIVK